MADNNIQELLDRSRAILIIRVNCIGFLSSWYAPLKLITPF
jgi:hypothetical protein